MTLCVCGKKSQWRQKESNEFVISEFAGDCGCGLLGKGYSLESETWLLNPQLLPLLNETLRRFSVLSPDGFAFQSLWAGEDVALTQSVSLKELLLLVRENRVLRNCRYDVTNIA